MRNSFGCKTPKLWPNFLLSGFVMLCAVRVGAQETTMADPPLQVQAGEIRLEGTISSIDFEAKSFTLETTSFALPNGKTSRLNPIKPKVVLLPAKVLLYVRSAPEKPVLMKTLQVGQFAIAAGRDAGSGKPLPARAIALWDGIRNSRY